VEILTPENSPLVGLQLKKLNSKFETKVLICAVQRDGNPIIPTGNFTIQANDRLFITATRKNIYAFFKELGWNRQSRNILIVGGSPTAFYLCEELEKINADVKLIEKNKHKCQELSEKLSSTEILLGDGTDQELLHEEGIDDADAFVALGDIDEQNIIMSMFASSLEVPKVITKIDQLSYYDMLQRSGIYSAISTKTSTAEQIIRFVRLMSNKKGSGVERLFRIIDDKAEVLEFETEENFRRLNVPIQDLPLKKDLLIAGIIRDKKLITPSGKDCIQYDDNVIVVTLHEGLNNLNDILDF
ncbi:MAG: NAD-binding protein, partial [Clostridia bacterium]|nr:NAD-binding protein [Clostridia bacterium]